MSLVDSHCHLEMIDDAAAPWSRRAQPASSSVVTIGIDLRELAAGGRASPTRSQACTPPSGCTRTRRTCWTTRYLGELEELAARPARRRRGRVSASTSTATSRRATRSAAPSAPRSSWRGAPACRSSSTCARPATRPWRSWPPRPATSPSSCTATRCRSTWTSATRAATTRASPATSRTRTPATCARRPRRCATTGCWWRPTRRSSARCPTAATATCRPGSRTRRRWSPRCAAGTRRARRAHHSQRAPRLRAAGRRLKRGRTAHWRGARLAGAPARGRVRPRATAVAPRGRTRCSATARTTSSTEHPARDRRPGRGGPRRRRPRGRGRRRAAHAADARARAPRARLRDRPPLAAAARGARRRATRASSVHAGDALKARPRGARPAAHGAGRQPRLQHRHPADHDDDRRAALSAALGGDGAEGARRPAVRSAVDEGLRGGLGAHAARLPAARRRGRCPPPPSGRSPRVESSFVTLRAPRAAGDAEPVRRAPRTAAEYAAVVHLVRLAFGQRRKTLVNSLGGAAHARRHAEPRRRARGARARWPERGGAAGGARAAAVA